MALIFGTNTKILFSNCLLKTMAAFNPSGNWPGTASIGITVYAGTAPTADEISASWATYNSTTANYLVHFTGSVWNQPSNGVLINMSTVPSPTTPLRAGTATWGILWCGNPTAPQLASATLPLSNFFVVSVSDSVGDGIVRFTSTALNTGSPATIIDGSMASFI